MPAINLPTINIGEGDFKSKETMENILDTLMKYRKELNYLLMNLDVENMPTIGGLIGDIEGNYSLLTQTVDGIYMQVGNIEGVFADFRVEAYNITAMVTNNQGDIASLSIRADDITGMVGDNTGAIAALVITAQGIQTQVTNNKGDISTLTQTASGLQSQVTNLDSYTTSQISQLSSSINLKVTSAEVVNMLNVNTAGVQINANNIALTGITTMYSPTSPSTDYFTYFGNGVVLYENGLARLEIYHDGAITKFISDAMRFEGYFDFSLASVDGLQLKFA